MTLPKQYQTLAKKADSTHQEFMESLPKNLNLDSAFYENYYGSVRAMAEIMGSKQADIDNGNQYAVSQLAVAEAHLNNTVQRLRYYLSQRGVDKATAETLMNKLREVVHCEKTLATFRIQHRAVLRVSV